MNRTISNSVTILVLVASIAFNIWLYIQVEQLRSTVANQGTLHTYTIHWSELVNITAKQIIQEYIGEWTPDRSIKVMQISAWMGNPYDVLWEGDVYVALSSSASEPEDPDQLLMHYQFDSHAKSPIPHQLTEDLRPGFLVDEGKTIYVFRRFHNIGNVDIEEAGDCYVIIYYTFAS